MASAAQDREGTARGRKRCFALMDGLGRLFFGSDAFISYSRADAYDYAGTLAARLSQQGITAYLDQAGSEPGQDVPNSVLRAARAASVFVLVASPAAMRSSAVELEARTFPTTRPIVPVALGTDPRDWPPWTRIFTGLPVAVENDNAVGNGQPSDRVVERVVLAVGRWRQTRRVRVASQLAAALLLVLAAAAAIVGHQLAQTSLALGASRARLAELDGQLADGARRLASAEQSYAESRASLERLEGQIAARQKELEDLSVKLAHAQRARSAQIAATAEVWDFFETGIQDLYPQPSLTCERGQLSLQPALSIYFFSDRARVSEKAAVLLNALADCYLKLVDPPTLLVTGSLSKRRRNAGQQDMVQEALGGGTPAYDLALAQRQAEAVKHYLISRGVEARRIVTASRGHEASAGLPLAAMNNRAVITLEAGR